MKNYSSIKYLTILFFCFFIFEGFSANYIVSNEDQLNKAIADSNTLSDTTNTIQFKSSINVITNQIKTLRPLNSLNIS